MGKLSTHVLDIASGRPAGGMTVSLFRLEADTRRLLRFSVTNADGRTDEPLLSAGEVEAGEYELVFGVGAYFKKLAVPAGEPPFLGDVPVRFTLVAGGSYHIPLLCSPWAYQTYRGS
jgi:5-hydroxyisourate hydrolase